MTNTPTTWIRYAGVLQTNLYYLDRSVLLCNIPASISPDSRNKLVPTFDRTKLPFMSNLLAFPLYPVLPVYSSTFIPSIISPLLFLATLNICAISCFFYKFIVYCISSLRFQICFCLFFFNL